MVQWLRPQASTAGYTDSIPGGELGSCVRLGIAIKEREREYRQRKVGRTF